MDVLVNDLSLHEQFNSGEEFRSAIRQIMRMRAVASRFGRSLLCHRNFLNRMVGPEMSMQHAAQALSKEERRSLLSWLTREGPFWEDARVHSEDVYLESQNEVVTDTGLGEAAWCCMNGSESSVVSLSPSDWELTPIRVTKHCDSGSQTDVDVENYWQVEALAELLEGLPLPAQSWAELYTYSRSRFSNLVFATNAFEPLQGHPFVVGAAKRIVVLLDILSRMKNEFDTEGNRTAEGQRLYEEFCTGKKGEGGRGSLFSASSEQEMNDFRADMTFPDPVDPDAMIFCPYHGKVQTPQYRIHCSWPVRADEALRVVYVGPKITRR